MNNYNHQTYKKQTDIVFNDNMLSLIHSAKAEIMTWFGYCRDIFILPVKRFAEENSEKNRR